MDDYKCDRCHGPFMNNQLLIAKKEDGLWVYRHKNTYDCIEMKQLEQCQHCNSEAIITLEVKLCNDCHKSYKEFCDICICDRMQG